MRIVVCVKITGGEVSPFDGSALECALEMSVISGETIVLCMGPPSAKEPLERLTRLGVSRVVLISDSLYAGSDTLATELVLAEAIKRLEPDFVFCGRQSIDGDTAQVGPGISALLSGFSLVTNVMKWNANDWGEDCSAQNADCSCDGKKHCRYRDKGAKAPDHNETSIRTLETRLGQEQVSSPAVITFERIRELRFPSLRSRKKEIEIWDNSILKLDPGICGLKGSPTKVLEVQPAGQGRRRCRLIQWSELEPLIKKLRHAKPKKLEGLLPKKLGAERKLREVWAIGDEVISPAQAIAASVISFSSDPADFSLEEIVRKIREKKPEVVLWPSNFWGRKTAPQVAAILRTGLCADCTRLEVDEKGKFLMFRPALEGNVIAKIECRTRPQMATVRIPQAGSEIIVSAGRGVQDDLPEIEKFADKIQGQLGASRGLVDTGKVPYHRQIGLTGRAVAPKIYIAIGISGAVHHTCAIESAGTIIAINSDSKARIFEYADYGIIDHFNGKELNL